MPRIALLVVLASLTSCVLRHDPDVLVTPQRPTVSSDTQTAAVGTFELEAGVSLDPGDAEILTTTLKHGLDERTELFLGWIPYGRIDLPGDDGDGVGDAVFGMRRRVWERDDTAAAFQMATKIPTGDEDEGLSTGEIDFLLAGIVSHDLPGGPSLVGYYELGVIGEPRDADTDLQHLFAVAASESLRSDLVVFGELSKLHAAFGEDPLQGLVGIAKQARPGLVYDAAVSVGLNEDAPDFVLLLGLSTNIGRTSSRAQRPGG